MKTSLSCGISVWDISCEWELKGLCQVELWVIGLLDFSDFNICIECVKGKQTNIRKLGANRSSRVLEVIHTDICDLFPTASWNGQRYFITL